MEHIACMGGFFSKPSVCGSIGACFMAGIDAQSYQLTWGSGRSCFACWWSCPAACKWSNLWIKTAKEMGLRDTKGTYVLTTGIKPSHAGDPFAHHHGNCLKSVRAACPAYQLLDTNVELTKMQHPMPEDYCSDMVGVGDFNSKVFSLRSTCLVCFSFVFKHSHGPYPICRWFTC